MNPSKLICETIDKMVKDFNIEISKEDLLKLKEKHILEWCENNNCCYFWGSAR